MGLGGEVRVDGVWQTCRARDLSSQLAGTLSGFLPSAALYERVMRPQASRNTYEGDPLTCQTCRPPGSLTFTTAHISSITLTPFLLLHPRYEIHARKHGGPAAISHLPACRSAAVQK
jgi:hypothetical protein